MLSFNGVELEVGQSVLVQPKDASAVKEHFAVGTVTRITAKTVYVEFECDQGYNYRLRKYVKGLKEYPRKPNQVYVIS